METKQETLIVVLVAVSVFFGALAGGAAGFVATGMRFMGSLPWDELVQEVQVDRLQQEDAVIVDVVASSASSVVSILIQEKQNGQWVDVGGGTGVIVSSDGLVLTNRHVVDQEQVQFVLIGHDGAEHPAAFVDADPFLDLAVLRFEQNPEAPYPAAPLGDSDALRVGQTVIAIGNTLSEFPHSVTRGIISGLNRTIVAGGYFDDAEVIDHAIQTDAAISEGNSGGPLLNVHGEVVGINTAVSYDGQSIGFAIPINSARSLLTDIEQFGRVVRPWLGVQYMMIDRELRMEYAHLPEEGAFILPNALGESPSVIPGSPAEKAGLLSGDVIRSVNGEVVSPAAPLGERINAYNPGDRITLGVERDGVQMDVAVTLEEVDESKL